ncbi:aminotransferase class IV [Pontibacter oryzae]|uniref:branched-chain-amino-acid transaminase n=1 Tax=Pontibacter oryzae TaxID=2304593 RepID=A0A399SIC8_9BACT|nr:aminotransferase class IV [Pontibacter oryzae]RIJ41627.1 hypothetical protein D1627_06245 [Pontibacter oryzae]
MKLLYSGQLLHEEALHIPATNRAFQYNDGFFETIIIVNGKLRFWKSHQERMQEAALALGLELPGYFLDVGLEHQLVELAKQNSAELYGRVKLKVWRGGNGLYTPDTNTAHWLATAVASEPAPFSAIEIGICQKINTAYHALSGFKGPNAPLYVLAGIEKKERQLDDMLLLSPQGWVSELTSSNIFWVQDNQFYTPSLNTGCVNGILRRQMLAWCAANSFTYHEVQVTPKHVFMSDTAFAINITGIRSIRNIDQVALRQQPELLHRLRVGLGIV